jgi:hypothetical protein
MTRTPDLVRREDVERQVSAALRMATDSFELFARIEELMDRPESAGNAAIYRKKAAQCLEANAAFCALPTAAGDVERLRDAARKLDPYLDDILCYASTTKEYNPNKAVAAFRAALSQETEDG